METVSHDSQIDILSLVRGTNDELMRQSKQWNLVRLPDLEWTQSHRESVGERNADDKSRRPSTRTTDRLSGSRRSSKGELRPLRTHRAPISGPALEATVVHSAAASSRTGAETQTNLKSSSTGAEASDIAGPVLDTRELMRALSIEQSRQQRDEVLDIGQETCDSHPNNSEPEAEADLCVTMESVLRQWYPELTTSQDSVSLQEYELALQLNTLLQRRLLVKVERLHDEMEAREATAQENEILRKQLSKVMTLLVTPQQGSRDVSTLFDATSAATARQASAAVVTANRVMPSPHRPLSPGTQLRYRAKLKATIPRSSIACQCRQPALTNAPVPIATSPSPQYRLSTASSPGQQPSMDASCWSNLENFAKRHSLENLVNSDVVAPPATPSTSTFLRQRTPPDFMSITRRCSVGTQSPCNASPAPVDTHRQPTRLIFGSSSEQASSSSSSTSEPSALSERRRHDYLPEARMRVGNPQYGGSVLMPPGQRVTLFMPSRPESARQRPFPLPQLVASIMTGRPESARRQPSPPFRRSVIVTSQATNLTQPVVSQRMVSAPITGASSSIGSRKSSPTPSFPIATVRVLPVANSSAPRTAALCTRDSQLCSESRYY